MAQNWEPKTTEAQADEYVGRTQLVHPTYSTILTHFLFSALNRLRLQPKLRSDFLKVVYHVKLQVYVHVWLNRALELKRAK